MATRMIGAAMTRPSGRCDGAALPGSFLSVALNIILVVAILGYFGVETTSFAALVAGIGVAIGAAWSGLLGNFASGIFLLVLRPYQVGDYVMIGGAEGVVLELGMFGTTINTPDNVKTVIGNSKVIGNDIRNYAANPYRRVELAAQLAGGADVHKAMLLLKAAVSRVANISAAPAPVVEILEFNEFGPSSRCAPSATTTTTGRSTSTPTWPSPTRWAPPGSPWPRGRFASIRWRAWPHGRCPSRNGRRGAGGRSHQGRDSPGLKLPQHFARPAPSGNDSGLEIAHEVARWLRWSLIVLAVLATYAALGFWGVPFLVERQLPRWASRGTGAQASISNVRFNPFTLRFEAGSLRLAEASGEPLFLRGPVRRATEMAIDRAQGLELRRSAPRRSAGLPHLRRGRPLQCRRTAGDGDAPMAAGPGRPQRPAAPQHRPDGRGAGQGAVPGPAVGYGNVLTPIDFTLANFSTLPGEADSHSFVAMSPRGGVGALEGNRDAETRCAAAAS
jgi:small conductance mechanosensitive channel